MQQAILEGMDHISAGVLALDLRAADTGLAPWEPGAHIDLALPNWLTRQYSLCGDPADRERYRVAVRYDRLSRGGSEYIHRFLRPRRKLNISLPRNNFPLVRASAYLFIAGGIGITPIRPMLRAAVANGAAVRLIYVGKSRSAMPFTEELVASYGERVRIIATDREDRPDFAELAADLDPAALVYCCGPAPLLAAAESVFPAERLHAERFRPTAREFRPNTAFQVVCARSGQTIQVPPEDSLLDALNHAGLGVPSGCREGVCGSCELTVLSGEPEHRDDIGAESTRIYPCVSRALSAELTLDL